MERDVRSLNTFFTELHTLKGSLDVGKKTSIALDQFKGSAWVFDSLSSLHLTIS